MRYPWLMSTLFLGMGIQAACTALVFPDGTTGEQQLVAAVVFMVLSVVFAALGTALHRQGHQ